LTNLLTQLKTNLTNLSLPLSKINEKILVKEVDELSVLELTYHKWTNAAERKYSSFLKISFLFAQKAITE
jgi:hypothetical protein